ncbi:hypothetical protein [Vibrio harveyi]|uniref:hypothetical protein n=1 Tax=Vibrio harveyi TaxID=669 RepID=UPI0006811FFB|nr:hypothetical protein [Vibrio harveyi]
MKSSNGLTGKVFTFFQGLGYTTDIAMSDQQGDLLTAYLNHICILFAFSTTKDIEGNETKEVSISTIARNGLTIEEIENIEIIIPINNEKDEEKVFRKLRNLASNCMLIEKKYAHIKGVEEEKKKPLSWLLFVVITGLLIAWAHHSNLL